MKSEVQNPKDERSSNVNAENGSGIRTSMEAVSCLAFPWAGVRPGFRTLCPVLAPEKSQHGPRSQELLEFPNAEASIFHDSSHGEGIDRIGPRE
jgi:hypothetical protein